MQRCAVARAMTSVRDSENQWIIYDAGWFILRDPSFNFVHRFRPTARATSFLRRRRAVAVKSLSRRLSDTEPTDAAGSETKKNAIWLEKTTNVRYA